MAKYNFSSTKSVLLFFHKFCCCWQSVFYSTRIFFSSSQLYGNTGYVLLTISITTFSLLFQAQIILICRNRLVHKPGECTVFTNESNHGTVTKNVIHIFITFCLKVFRECYWCLDIQSIILLVFNPNLNPNHTLTVSKLQSVQNFTTRIVTGSRKHITPVLSDLNWLSVCSIPTYIVAFSRLYV